MKVGLLGLPQSGKSTLFALLTGFPPDPERKGVVPGVAPIRDSRLDWLAKIYKPKKVTPVTLEVNRLPSLGEREKEALQYAEKMDVLVYVVRAFHREEVYHPLGEVDPSRDVKWLERELILEDWSFLKKRLERMEKEKRAKKVLPQERELLEKMVEHLEKEKPLRTFPLREEEERWIRSYPLLTRKPLVVVLNLGEGKEEQWEREIYSFLEKAYLLSLPLKLEQEVMELEEKDRREFLKEFGIEGSALEKLGRACLEALGRITFFTVKSGEVRAWTVRKGAKAPEAARVIHSDLEKGFIRAEVMKYKELYEQGDEKKLKELGKVYLRGKEYQVEEGDILHILFRV